MSRNGLADEFKSFIDDEYRKFVEMQLKQKEQFYYERQYSFQKQ